MWRKQCFYSNVNGCCSVTQSCLNLCDSMDYSMPGFSILHHLPGSAQTHVHLVDAIQSYSLLPPSPPAFNLSQNQGVFLFFFLWVGSLHQVAKILELQIQHQSFQWILRVDRFDLLAVQGTLKSLLWNYSSKASILQWILQNTSFMKENELSMGNYN